MKKPWFALWLIVSLAAVFARHHDYLSRGWIDDDFAFLQSAKNGYYGTVPSSWIDWAAFWNPWRGWFYRPTFLSYWAIFHTLGIARPEVMHAAGLVLHALVISSWGWLIYRLTRRAGVGILAGLSFLLWPGKEEAIWWIASHSALLATLFSIVTLHAWLSYRRAERPASKRAFFCVSLLCFWLALTSKNDAISVVFALPLLDFAEGNFGLKKRVLGAYAPVFALWLVYGFCEWSAARTYAGNDPYLRGMLQMSLARRFSFLPTAIQSSSLALIPIRDLFSMLILGVGIITFFRREKFGPTWSHPPSIHSKPDQVLALLAVFALGWFFLAIAPVALAAGNHSGGSRFITIRCCRFPYPRLY